MTSKKTLIIVAVATFISLSSTYVASKHFVSSNENGSSLLKNNIEALSDLPEHQKLQMQCVRTIKYTGSYSMPLYCPTCSYKYGYSAVGGYSKCP